MPTSTSPPTPRSTPASARRASAAWPSPRSSPSSRSPTSWSPSIAERISGLYRRRRARRGADMGPLVTGAHRDKVASYLDAGVAAGATLVVDGRGHADRGRRGRLLAGPDAVRPRDADMALYTDEIFGPVLSVDPRRQLRRRARAREREPVRQRRRDLHQRRRRRPSLREWRSRSAWWGSTCRSPCPSRTTRSAAGRARCSATPMRTDRRHALLHTGQGGDQPVARSQPRRR